MLIKISDYSDGIHDLALEKKAEELELEEPFFGKVKVDGRMDKASHQIYLDCEVLSEAKFICDRCAEEYIEHLANNFQLIYLISRSEEENEDENVYFINPETTKINISGDVIEFVKLSVPMKKLCRDDCKGLCPKCGTNLNHGTCDCENEYENPVWEKLKEIKKDSNKS
ncbi:MAG: DUF177 domain-containing protein [Melioribacteraceae bacterium]|nr:DUF177 domain-containing protein [Melioribacteraceae bacterium]MCF8352824.1 DUF177 domain-containing protein [Melioribacteraceae bacterium]MCF8393456.1 DUF177 domain-containing protein [Melioribacteraceae bacterium]MCF8417341.1 DUF177 domain-containing protein [Melioribacteraceae bacterium]